MLRIICLLLIQVILLVSIVYPYPKITVYGSEMSLMVIVNLIEAPEGGE